MRHLSSMFKAQSAQVSNTVRALIKEADSRPTTVWKASLEDSRLLRLEALVIELGRLTGDIPPDGPGGPPGSSSPGRLSGPAAHLDLLVYLEAPRPLLIYILIISLRTISALVVSAHT